MTLLAILSSWLVLSGDDEANRLLRDADRGYRAPFVVPEEV